MADALLSSGLGIDPLPPTPGLLIPYHAAPDSSAPDDRPAPSYRSTGGATHTYDYFGSPVAEIGTVSTRKPLSPLLHSTTSGHSKAYNPVLSPSTTSPRRFAAALAWSPRAGSAASDSEGDSSPGAAGRRQNQPHAQWPELQRAKVTELAAGGYRISAEEAQELRDTFAVFDFEGAGALDFRQLAVALEALRFNVEESQLERELSECGKTKDKLISLEEFVELGSSMYEKRSQREEAQVAFETFDVGGTGRVSLRNLQAAARSLGVAASAAELQSMIDEFDLDGDGRISLQEFERILLGYDDAE
mmetsp:Transcript_8757/g.22481  ORF Transcript_8757/g.22481 Transcript_8757/m.22481 type:complete len:304 (-) Transcript_8757:109-1020(-)